MSLGFLTESALLPSKSKKIEVDGRSQLPLKAIVAEELSKREAAGEGSSEGLRKARGRKRAMEEGGKRDVYGGRNKGVEERNRRDAERDQLENPLQRHKRADQILKRKAEDYERILRGEEELPDEDDEDNLVDFARKREQQQGAAAAGSSEGKRAKQQKEEGKEKLPKGYAEMIDEFGRTRVVPKDSAEFKAFKAVRDAQRQHEAFFGKKHRDRHAPPLPFSAASSSSSYHAGGEAASSSYYGPASGDGEGRGKWAWSRGDEEAAARERAKREEKLRKRKEREAELVGGDERGSSSTSSSAVQQGAVRTQWERRLESQAHEFLPQVISEEAASRQQQQRRQQQGGAGGGGADDGAAQVQRVKEERRQKLLARLQQKQK